MILDNDHASSLIFAKVNLTTLDQSSLILNTFEEQYISDYHLTHDRRGLAPLRES